MTRDDAADPDEIDAIDAIEETDGFPDEPAPDDPGGITWGPLTGIAMTVLAALGLAAAFTLAVDKVKLLQDPEFVPSCNFNPVLSCGSVMNTDQAAVFGFPNPFLGIVGFSVMVTVGVLLAAGVRLPTPIMVGAAIGTILGTVFVHWLIFQSLYRIGALCPWCMVVWAVTIPLAWWFTLKALDQLGLRRVVRPLWDWRYTLVGLWYVGVAVLVLIRFWDYWSSRL